ncbi:Uncharacterized protein SVXHr_1134 [Halorhabdus sp. SVX81]|uniref:hypothetical protein n=1 Tax=Halorhabdus sp. SVX81 TaxID=2978283 RepID=UPI0023DB9204|nr:hypothetical protein [Halorhabdus sp. SVX81]WEL17308.1 Uncharacterized protein SVXHr_1134 [Halorhabdus sp. SVX81]
MAELSITERQHDRLEDVRQEVEAAYVESYGETRPQDAIEYLLDTYTPPEERAIVAAYEKVATATYPTLQQIASDVEDVPGSGIEAAEMRGRLLAALGPEALAERLRAAETETDEDERSPAGESASDREPDVDSTPTKQAGPPAEKGSPATTEASTQAGTETDTSGADKSTVDGDDGDGSLSASQTGSSAESHTESASDGQAESASDDQTDAPSTSPLASVNKLLDDHSEKWRKGQGDAPYEVDLPDGTTKSARTKDDVRQLLFRHY